MDRYYLAHCASCPALLGSRGQAVERVYAGRELRFCSEACDAAFQADATGVLARLDALMIVDQRPHYPLSTSLVTGEPLGPRPLDFIWGNRLFRASGPDERDHILRNPAPYLRKLNEAVLAAQHPFYGMPDKCPVQGDILPSDVPVDIVVANRMIRVCCGRCVHVVRARPYQYLALVEYANRQARERHAAEGRTPP